MISSVTSEYFFARLLALSLIALSQPWSACGPAKPMVTALPGLSSAAGWSSFAAGSSSGSLLVQPVSEDSRPDGGGPEEQSSAACERTSALAWR